TSSVSARTAPLANGYPPAGPGHSWPGSPTGGHPGRPGAIVTQGGPVARRHRKADRAACGPTDVTAPASGTAPSGRGAERCTGTGSGGPALTPPAARSAG